MSETFVFDVNYGTTFADLEKLREKMLAFVKSERREFQPAFDVSVKGMSNPTLHTSCPIRYISHHAPTRNRVNSYLFGFALAHLLRFADFPEQTKMTLSADIKYKSNLQHAALRGVYSLLDHFFVSTRVILY